MRPGMAHPRAGDKRAPGGRWTFSGLWEGGEGRRSRPEPAEHPAGALVALVAGALEEAARLGAIAGHAFAALVEAPELVAGAADFIEAALAVALVERRGA